MKGKCEKHLYSENDWFDKIGKGNTDPFIDFWWLLILLLCDEKAVENGKNLLSSKM